MSDFKLGTMNVVEESARGTQHPPVIRTLAVKPNQGVLPVGLLLENSASGLVPWNPAATPVAVMVGVLDRECDTATQTSGLVVVHGSVRQSALKVGAAAPADPDETALAAVLTAGLYTE